MNNNELGIFIVLATLLALLIVIFIIIMIIGYNSLVEKRRKIERNNSLVDVYLKKRFDLIPNLIEVCKG